MSGQNEKAHDEDAVSSRLELRKQLGQEDELGRGVAQVRVRLHLGHVARLEVGRDEIRVPEQLAQLHQDVVAAKITRGESQFSESERQEDAQAGLARLGLDGRLGRLRVDRVDRFRVPFQDRLVCGGQEVVSQSNGGRCDWNQDGQSWR